MQLHTLIIGTSKSKSKNGYYIHAKSRFWELIYESGLSEKIFNPEDYELFTKKHGVSFDEIYTDNIASKDKVLKVNLEMIENGIVSLIKRLDNHTHLKTITFNGKTAAGWFFEYIDKGKLSKRSSKYYSDKFGVDNYGKIIDKYKNIQVYVLPNTSGLASKTWKKEPWIEFWKSINDINV